MITAELTTRQRIVRVAAAAVVGVLLLAGTVWGVDDDFPLGPFRMYSTRTDPDGVVRELHVQLVLASGAIQDVTDDAGAPRRAELEGRVNELATHPAELAALVPRYTAHLSQPARTLRLVWLNHPLHGGRSGPSTITVICAVEVAP